MCPPDYYTVRDVKNPFMDVARGIDARLARRQWEALREAFRTAGVEVYEIAPVADLEDMVFAANQAFVAPSGRFVVPSRMRFASRRREVPYYVDWFRAHDFAICELDLGAEFLEGHGDLLTHPSRAEVWAGYGFRSSRGGVERFAAAMEPHGIRTHPLELVDPTFYHLDTCFAPLNEEAALLYPQALAEPSVRALRERWERLYTVSREEALAFVCNGVSANGRFIASHVPGRVGAWLDREGLEPLPVDLREFEAGGGSAFCLKCFLPPSA